MTQPATLSLIILGHNKAEISALCLKSILSLTYRPLQIVFVNNGSTDHTRIMLEQFITPSQEAGIEFKVISLPENQGSISPRNLALKSCVGRWIGFLDNDVIVRSRDLFDQLISFLSRNQRVGIVSPKFVYPCPPFRIQCAGGGITREGKCYLIGRGVARDRPEHNLITSVPWTISACMVMSADLVRELGPLDEVFSPTGFEDTDYCLRARVRGKEIIYFPGVELYHFENTTTFGTESINIDRSMRRNQRIFRKKWSHVFPCEPSVADLPFVHLRGPQVPLWHVDSLPLI